MDTNFLRGGGELSEYIHSTNWKKNPLGAIEEWSSSLQTSLSICLNTPFPCLIGWGHDLIMLYNTEYSYFLNASHHSNSLGKPMKEVWPELWEQIGPLIKNVLKTGESVLLEDQLFPLTTNGRKEDRYFTFSYSPIWGQNEIAGIFKVIHETTDKVKSLKRVKREQERLTQFFNQAPAALCILDGPEMTFELVNPSYQKLVPGRSLLGKPLFEVIPELLNTPIQDILLNVYKTGESFEGREVPMDIAKNDATTPETLYFNFIYQARRDPQQNVNGILVFAYEVNDLVLAKQQVESNFKRFETLANTLPQILWTSTPDGNLDYFNNKWFSFSGLNPEQSLGQGWASRVHPEDLPELLNKWERCLKTGLAYQIEARLRNFENRYHWSLIRALPIKDENNTIIQWCGTCTLIQDQKELEQRLQTFSRDLFEANEEVKETNKDLVQLNNQLLRVNSDLDNFIYTASHDLKAPISNIEGLIVSMTRYLSKESRENVMVSQILPMIDSSIDRFKRTLQDLTEITKLQRISEDEETHISLKNMIEEIAFDLSSSLQETNGKILVELDNLSEIQFSSKNLRSILYNLISNSLKYRSLDKDPVVKISTCELDQYSVITIQDNGMGMDLSNRKSIFGMFVRLHNHVEGSGIGLYIVKKIIENAGGKIEVKSKLGEGSTFKLYLKKSVVKI